MKFIVHVLIALLALYGAFTLYHDIAPPEWPRWEPKVVEPPPPPPEPARVSDISRILCPTCDGEGKLSYADSRGANHVYPCPICNSMGSRDLRVREGQHVCPDCKGMGVTERREARSGFGGQQSGNRDAVASSQNRESTDDAYFVRSTRCIRCNTSGLITSAKTTPLKATPGVQTPQSAR